MIKIFRSSFFCLLLLACLCSEGQDNSIPIFKGALKANRTKMYDHIVGSSITQNLSLPLADSTEADWQDAFYGVALINYKQPWINEKINTAFKYKDGSDEFKRSLLEMLYATSNKNFTVQAMQVLQQTSNAKVFAMCGEYLLMCNSINKTNLSLIKKNAAKLLNDSDTKSQVIINSFTKSLEQALNKSKKYIAPVALFSKNYLKGNVVLFSLQRRNRNYPGIVLVRDTGGSFITTGDKHVFFVPQLARSISNLPGYLTNGNTPQGIFRIYGFAVSKSPALGPTENLQLTMPFETSLQHFLKDSTITDTAWTEQQYKKLLPPGLQNKNELMQTYYASQAGRTEIIAHGTTVDPEYYKGQTYYPHTPTAGCLCAKEIWSEITGKRMISDQQKLVDAVKKAGGADGYLIVIEIDDQQKPVSVDEILPYLKKQ
jgi:hypothetical protein